jgi:hypothetical protein
MKSIIFYVAATILVIVFMVIVLNNRKEIPKILLTVPKYYSYIDLEDTMDVSLFINQKHHPLRDEKSYLTVYLTNLSKTKMIEVELIEIYTKHEEIYLNQVFYQDVLRLKLPYLGSDYHIADLYMEITLQNLEKYHVEIGRFSLISSDDNADYLNWMSLSGIKTNTSILSRLSQIDIEYDRLDREIIKIQIGLLVDVQFEITDRKIKIYIPDAFFMLNEVPIIITFSNLDTQIISHFTYFRDFQTLSKNGILIQTYAIN